MELLGVAPGAHRLRTRGGWSPPGGAERDTVAGEPMLFEPRNCWPPEREVAEQGAGAGQPSRRVAPRRSTSTKALAWTEKKIGYALAPGQRAGGRGGAAPAACW